ncbi:putative thimet oligopeptidase [Camellia lanceoleosa]|uniref:Thimet oligopeptidase n=1 Tax=Camellia lanceoleosa TaxID=1840588 RepID=A0ACC0G855_9ERIC|nr:putative thimet oligopeptidase [Camellia lanceoleosa]
MPKQKRENRNTNLVALTGSAALLAIAVNFTVNALKKNRKKKDLPGSTVQVNLSPPEILRLANHIIAKSKEVHDSIASVPLDKVRDFERSGLSLTLTKREELQRLSAQIDELSGRYIRNLNDDSTSLLSLDKAENGKFKVTLRSHHVSPILELCKVGLTRRIVAVAYGRRCEVNLSILESLVQLRHKSARLLGYSNYADYAVNHRMVNSSSKVFEFLEELSASLTDLATRELSMLKDFEELRNMVVGALKQYFPFNLVMSGILKICQDLFGLRFEEIADAEVWHSDVHLYSVYDLSSSELLGYFYLDMFSREGKYGHTCVVALQNGSFVNGARKIPVALLTSRLQKEVGHTALLRFSEVVNLFHEFGHVIPVGGRTLSTNMKIAFSALSLILFQITYTNCPTVRSAGTRLLSLPWLCRKFGCFSCYECVLPPVDAATTFALRIPTIGIGVQLRHKSARLLGYSNYADYAINHRMANSSSKVFEFLEELSAVCVILVHQKKEEGDFPFGIEDLLYYVKRIEEQQFNLDVGALKQYFPFNLVMSGILKICQDLFGLRFEEIARSLRFLWHYLLLILHCRDSLKWLIFSMNLAMCLFFHCAWFAMFVGKGTKPPS